MSLRRAKYLYRVIDERAGNDQPPLLAVSIRHGVIRRDAITDDLPRAEDLSNYKLCERDDIVLNRMRAFQGAIGISPCRGLVSPDYAVLRPSPTVDAHYLSYLFRSTWFVGEMTCRLRGIGNTENGAVRTPRINLEDFGEILVDCPSIDEQYRIANFLEIETNRIAALSRVYETVKSVITERVQCLIDMLVDGAGASVPFKYLVRFREGPGIMAVDFRDQGIPLIRISGLQYGKVTLAGANYLDEDLVATRWSQFRLRLGDYLISASATMGAVSIVDDPAVVGAVPYTGLIILRPVNPQVLMEYIAVTLNSSLFKRQIDLLKAGAAMQHFGPTHLGQVNLPLPDLASQRAIASAASDAWDQSTRLISIIDRQLDLLAERRRALIAAAVARGIGVTMGTELQYEHETSH